MSASVEDLLTILKNMQEEHKKLAAKIDAINVRVNEINVREDENKKWRDKQNQLAFFHQAEHEEYEVAIKDAQQWISKQSYSTSTGHGAQKKQDGAQKKQDERMDAVDELRKRENPDFKQFTLEL